jgi:hypothetical protein
VRDVRFFFLGSCSDNSNLVSGTVKFGAPNFHFKNKNRKSSRTMRFKYNLFFQFIFSQSTTVDSAVGEAVSIAKEIPGARTLLFDPAGTLLTIARTTQKVYAFYETSPNSGKFSPQVVLDCSNLNYEFSQ